MKTHFVKFTQRHLDNSTTRRIVPLDSIDNVAEEGANGEVYLTFTNGNRVCIIETFDEIWDQIK